MGTRWLWLLALMGLFGPSAPQGKVTARIEAHPPAPSPYHRLLLSCEVSGTTSPQQFLWEKQGSREPLQKGPDNVLLIASFNETHCGTYVCTATTSQGSVVATYNLQINDLSRHVLVFPQETNDSYVLVKATPEQPLQNFSVCLRSYTDLTRPYSLFSYATKGQDSDIALIKRRPGEYQLYVGGKSVSFPVPEETPMESQHVCATWEATTGIVGFWVNGKARPCKGLQKGYTVSNEALIVLGQKQDSRTGAFDAGQAFTGELRDVYMWDSGLSSRDVASAMDNSPLKTPIFGWRNFPYETEGEVYLKP